MKITVLFFKPCNDERNDYNGSDNKKKIKKTNDARIKNADTKRRHKQEGVDACA